jgi:hypothetical protein
MWQATAPPRVKLKAIKQALRLNGFDANCPVHSDKQKVDFR